MYGVWGNILLLYSRNTSYRVIILYRVHNVGDGGGCREGLRQRRRRRRKSNNTTDTVDEDVFSVFNDPNPLADEIISSAPGYARAPRNDEFVERKKKFVSIHRTRLTRAKTRVHFIARTSSLALRMTHLARTRSETTCG